MAGKNSVHVKIILSIFIVATCMIWLPGVSVRAAETNLVGIAQSTKISCIQPATKDERDYCRELERRILDVTVIIDMQVQFYLQGHRLVKETHSHATILAGRYLVTHNHFQFSLTEMAKPDKEGYLAISVRKVDGVLILDHAPLSVLEIAHTDPQTQVLEFNNEHGDGLFSALGLPSAVACGWDEIILKPGDELAEIDWNGVTPHVDWVRVDQVLGQPDVPQLQVANFARAGSSGGGVFWNGQHIGNTWARNIETDSTSKEVTRRYTMIALNSPAIAVLGK